MKFQQIGSKVASSPEINKLLKERYFLKHENSWDDVAKRVSSILPEIYPYIRDHYFCPSTPTLFNLNTNGERMGTLSSCFTMPIEDSITGIMDSAKDCAIVTKASGGVGYCFDGLRGQNEKIKTLNRNSSGPLPFIKIFSSILDGINQSGVRRGAGMAQLSIDHPSILMFIDAKKDPSIHDFDRFNFSVRVPDWFYEKLDNSPDEVMMVKNVVDGQKFALMEDGKSITIKELWDRVVQRGWQSAEPGVFNNSIAFDRCTVTNLSKTVLSNPCMPGWVKVLSKSGIKELSEINVGDEIWSKEGWTKVTKKWSTGIKDVYSFRTSFGVFYGTENHQVVCGGQKVQASDACGMDLLRGPIEEVEAGLNKQDIVDGLVVGDGMSHKASKNLVLLNIGENDKDYFNSEISDFILEKYEAGHCCYKIKTTITHDELGRTYSRSVPERFIKNKNKICSFLRGLFSANGSVCGTRVTLKASSFQIIEDVQLMLSSIGISSYFTCNKEHSVSFKNGDYVCKESYDLNILRDISIFNKKIGFIQQYKNDKVNKVISSKKRTNREEPIKRIISKKFISKEEVFDITVDNLSHTFWTNCCDVSNCQEFISVESSSCNLGSINLVKSVKDNSFDFESFEKVVRVATNYLNKIIDNNKFPLEKIKEISLKTRPIGLGFMGLAHTFYLLGLSFTSKEANELLKKIVLSLTLTSLEESVELAKKDGPYEAFDLDLFLRANDRFFHDERGRKLRESIIDNGIRNHATTSIAPCGSISYLFDVSSGVEPVYALSYSRKIEKEGKKYEEVFLSDRFFGAYLDTNYPYKKQEILKNVVDNNGSCQKCKILTEEERAIFITAQDMSAKEHLDSLEIVANNISFSVSKCVAKGTKILTDKGIKNIEDLGGASGDDNFGNPINARVKDMNGNWKKITKHYSGGKKPTKIIKFNNGNSIEFADTHKLLTNNGWTKVSSLNVDDFIYCRSSTYETNNVGQLKIDWSTKFNDKTNSNEVNLPIKMSDELSLFLGMIAADGHLTESTGNVGITTADDKVESVFKELCNKIFKAKIVNIQKDKRTKNTRSVFITSRKLCRYLIQLFGGHNCMNKTVPKQIINGSVSEKINFINGITLDGFVKGNRLVLYCGYSKELVDSIFYMCCELGLKPNKSKSFVKNGRLSKWAYGISVPHNYFHPIEEHKNKTSKNCFDMPVPQKLKEISYKDLDKKYHGSFKTLKYNKYNSIRSNNSLLELVDWDNDLYLLKIVSIENSFNDVYDIEVEETHSYLIDNVISHNTINLPNSATVEDVSHVYRDAHRRGIIGVTVYRDGCREGILSSTKKEEKSDLVTTNAPKRPKSVHGELHHFTVAGIKYYVAVGMYGPKKQVFEVFTGINQEKDELFIPKTLKAGSITKMGSGLYSFVTEDGDEYKLCNGHTDPATESLTRMLSLSLRHGASLHFCIDQLQKSHGAINTFSKILSRTLKKYVGDGSKSSETCSCGGKLIYESGCKKCPECGVSHCG